MDPSHTTERQVIGEADRRALDDQAALEAAVERTLDDHTVEELREQLRDRDLPVSGTKDELVARLTEAEVADLTDDPKEG